MCEVLRADAKNRRPLGFVTTSRATVKTGPLDKLHSCQVNDAQGRWLTRGKPGREIGRRQPKSDSIFVTHSEMSGRNFRIVNHRRLDEPRRLDGISPWVSKWTNLYKPLDCDRRKTAMLTSQRPSDHSCFFKQNEIELEKRRPTDVNRISDRDTLMSEQAWN